MKPGIDHIGISTPFYCNDGHGSFLLHNRSENCRDEHGTWDTGGGQLEMGLSPAENVLKEVKEEYGCDGTIQETLPAFSLVRKVGSSHTHWLILPFFVLVERNKVINAEPHKMVEIGWYRLGFFPKPLHSGLVLALQKYKNYFEKYGRVTK